MHIPRDAQFQLIFSYLFRIQVYYKPLIWNFVVLKHLEMHGEWFGSQWPQQHGHWIVSVRHWKNEDRRISNDLTRSLLTHLIWNTILVVVILLIWNMILVVVTLFIRNTILVVVTLFIWNTILVVVTLFIRNTILVVVTLFIWNTILVVVTLFIRNTILVVVTLFIWNTILVVVILFIRWKWNQRWHRVADC